MSILSFLTLCACFANASSALPTEPFNYLGEELGGGASYLGVDTRDVTTGRLAALQLQEERGVEVTMVDQDAPAGKAGIKEHDVILTINNEPVESVEQLRRMIHEIPPGRAITLGISRGGHPLTLKAQLANRKNFSGWAPGVKLVMPNLTTTISDLDIPASIVVVHSSARSGLLVENLSPQLSEFFGAKDKKGVLVRSVEKGSCAENAGFLAGDVIIRVDGDPVSDAGGFSQAIRNRKSGTVIVEIVRERKERTLTLSLPDPKQSGGFEHECTPKIGAEVDQEMERMKSELAQAKPQLDAAQRELARLQPTLEKQTREMAHQARQLALQERQWLKPEIQNQVRELSKQLQQWRDQHPEQLQQQLRQLLRQHGDI